MLARPACSPLGQTSLARPCLWVNMTPLTLIIDGNNLAYHLYQLPTGSRLTAEIDGWLVKHLTSYVEDQGADRVRVELCLDRGRGATLATAGVRVYVAQYPRLADDEVLDRLDLHRSRRDPCVVVSRDGAIAEAAMSGANRVWPLGE